MIPQVCPRCGAPLHSLSDWGLVVYRCGSSFWQDTPEKFEECDCDQEDVKCCRYRQLEKEIERLRGGPPGPFPTCSDCGRAMVWERVAESDCTNGSWVCPACVMQRIRWSERESEDRKREEAADRRLRETDSRLLAEMRNALRTRDAEVERLRAKVKQLSELLDSLTKWPEGLPLLTEDELAKVKAAMDSAKEGRGGTIDELLKELPQATGGEHGG